MLVERRTRASNCGKHCTYIFAWRYTPRHTLIFRTRGRWMWLVHDNDVCPIWSAHICHARPQSWIQVHCCWSPICSIWPAHPYIFVIPNGCISVLIALKKNLYHVLQSWIQVFLIANLVVILLFKNIHSLLLICRQEYISLTVHYICFVRCPILFYRRCGFSR